MNSSPLPPLVLSQWRSTRDALHSYCRVFGRIKRSLVPWQKHWWHISLRVLPYGLSTSPVTFPGGENETFEMWMNLVGHRLAIRTSGGGERSMEMAGLPTSHFLEASLSMLAEYGIHPEIDRTLFQDSNPKDYDRPAVANFWNVLTRIDEILKIFKSELPGETSPVQFWPHNFDHALMWLPGRKIPGLDPGNEELSDVQMAFGFSTGDEGTPDAYLYVTAYPWPENLDQEPLPDGAVWHTEKWKGALLPYEVLAQSGNPEARLLDFFRSVYRTASARQR
jgi:hypothetical protein